uniref:Uncharacterized protein n=1 Tax=Glossina austeni TaxID=7395 RepID=A0A1A9UF89_GLOAU
MNKEPVFSDDIRDFEKKAVNISYTKYLSLMALDDRCTLDMTLKSLPVMVNKRSFLFFANVSGFIIAKPTFVKFTAYNSSKPEKASGCKYSIEQLAILIDETYFKPKSKKKFGPNSMGYLGLTSVTTKSVISLPNFCVPGSMLSVDSFMCDLIKSVWLSSSKSNRLFGISSCTKLNGSGVDVKATCTTSKSVVLPHVVSCDASSCHM